MCQRLPSELAIKNRWCLFIIMLMYFMGVYFYQYLKRIFCSMAARHPQTPIQTLHMWVHVCIICIYHFHECVCLSFAWVLLQEQTWQHDKILLGCSHVGYIIPKTKKCPITDLMCSRLSMIFRRFATDFNDSIYIFVSAGYVLLLWHKSRFSFSSSTAI